jgi:hypothetical protein
MRVRLLILVISIASAVSCGDGTKPSESIFATDETKQAADLVFSANIKLKLIKKRFKDNEPRYEELKTALRTKDEEKVRKLSGEFVDQIAAGTEEGNQAIETLRKARDMNINREFKEYLDLKITSLEKYVEAFEQRRQAAEILRSGYDPKNVMNRDRVIGEFKLKEEKFSEIIEDGRRSSQEANDFATESLRKKS